MNNEWGIRNDGGGRFVLMERRTVLGDDERIWHDVATIGDWPTALRLVRLLRRGAVPLALTLAGSRKPTPLDRCPTCGSDDPARQQGLPHTDLHAQVRCRDLWHSAPPVEENPEPMHCSIGKVAEPNLWGDCEVCGEPWPCPSAPPVEKAL